MCRVVHAVPQTLLKLTRRSELPFLDFTTPDLGCSRVVVSRSRACWKSMSLRSRPSGVSISRAARAPLACSRSTLNSLTLSRQTRGDRLSRLESIAMCGCKPSASLSKHEAGRQALADHFVVVAAYAVSVANVITVVGDLACALQTYGS